MNKSFYVYPASQPFAVTANLAATDGININDRYDFFCQYIVAKLSTSYSLLFNIVVNNVNMFNNSVLVENIAGTGQQANYMPIQMIFRKTSRVQINYQELLGSNQTIYLAFVGYEFIPAVVKK